jgi:hypothetical protein
MEITIKDVGEHDKSGNELERFASYFVKTLPSMEL